MILLVVFTTIHPTGDQNKIAAFTFNEGGGIYNQSPISKKLKELCFTQKVGSIEGYQALKPENIHRVHCFFNLPLPVGVRGVERCNFIDSDEFGVALERKNKK